MCKQFVLDGSELSPFKAITKVKYIGKTCVSLTNGKIYEVLSIESGRYRIVDDTEEDYLFNPEVFEIVSE